METLVSKSLDRRRDVRSVSQFKKDIKETTEREQMLMGLWAAEMKHRGHKIVYSDYGVDNSGEFLEHSDARPDFVVTLDGNTELYELKSNPWDHKQTFKIHDLKEYVKYAANILLFFGIGHDKKNIDKDNTKWGVIKPRAIDWLLTKTPCKGDPKWGNKPVVIIYPNEYDGYFKTERLTHLDGN